jgi:hypothetical protein
MKQPLLFLLLLTMLLVPVYIARADQAPSADYAISWYTVDGGSAISQGGDYNLQGTIGQADAVSLMGGDYTLAGGYWGAFTRWLTQYLPVILKAP